MKTVDLRGLPHDHLTVARAARSALRRDFPHAEEARVALSDEILYAKDPLAKLREYAKVIV